MNSDQILAFVTMLVNGVLVVMCYKNVKFADKMIKYYEDQINNKNP